MFSSIDLLRDTENVLKVSVSNLVVNPKPQKRAVIGKDGNIRSLRVLSGRASLSNRRWMLFGSGGCERA